MIKKVKKMGNELVIILDTLDGDFEEGDKVDIDIVKEGQWDDDAEGGND